MSWAVFALVVYSAISRGQMSAGAIALAVVGIGVALAAMRASRMGVEMSDAGVTVHRPFASDFVAWSDVAGVWADGEGLHVVRRSGGTVSAVGSGTSTWAALLHLDSLAEGGAADLREQAKAAQRNG